MLSDGISLCGWLAMFVIMVLVHSNRHYTASHALQMLMMMFTTTLQNTASLLCSLCNTCAYLFSVRAANRGFVACCTANCKGRFSFVELQCEAVSVCALAIAIAVVISC